MSKYLGCIAEEIARKQRSQGHWGHSTYQKIVCLLLSQHNGASKLFGHEETTSSPSHAKLLPDSSVPQRAKGMQISVVSDQLASVNKCFDRPVKACECQSFVTFLLLDLANFLDLKLDLPLLLHLLECRALCAVPFCLFCHGSSLGGEPRHETLQLAKGYLIRRGPRAHISGWSVLLLKALPLLLLNGLEQPQAVLIIGKELGVGPLGVRSPAVVSTLGKVKVGKLLVSTASLLEEPCNDMG